MEFYDDYPNLSAAGATPISVTIGNNTGNTFSGTEDAKLIQTSPTTNFGTNVQLEATKFGVGDHGNSVIRFPGLSSISGPVTVTAATLFLYQESGSGTYSVDLRRLLLAWIVSQVTWNNYITSTAWTTAGGEGSGTDIAAAVSATLNFDNSVGYKGFSAAQLRADIQNIINGVNPNNGWLVTRSDAGEDSLFKVLTSSEGTDTNRPYLALTYTSP